MHIDLEAARAHVQRIAPDVNADFSCVLIAAAVARQIGLKKSDIFVGALWAPSKFSFDKSPAQAMHGGWGVEFSAGDVEQIYLAEEEIDEDGSFNGHTWLASGQTIIDPMHDYCGSDGGPLDANGNSTIRYIQRPKLERLVKKYWAPQINALLRKKCAASFQS